jgi:hypothetical protein
MPSTIIISTTNLFNMRRFKNKKTTTRGYKKKTLVFNWSKKKTSNAVVSPHKRHKTLRKKRRFKSAA